MPRTAAATSSITISVPSKTSNSVYEIKQAQEGHWYCSCPAWRNQHLPADVRRCKHMDQVVLDLGNYVVVAHAAAKAG